MLYFTYFLIIVLFTIQVYTLILLKEKNKIPKPKSDEVYLAKIPKATSYTDVESDYKIFYDVMKSIKLEDWKCDITFHYDMYHVEFHSPNGLRFISRVRIYDIDRKNEVSLGILQITGTKSIALDRESFGKLKNDALIFIWDYIIKWHEDRNTETKNEILYKITEISKKLKTLRRTEQLDKLLKNEDNTN